MGILGRAGAGAVYVVRKMRAWVHRSMVGLRSGEWMCAVFAEQESDANKFNSDGGVSS